MVRTPYHTVSSKRDINVIRSSFHVIVGSFYGFYISATSTKGLNKSFVPQIPDTSFR